MDAPTEDAEPLSTGDKVKREIKEWVQTLAVFIPVFLLFTGLIYEQRVIPSESMVPTLQVGDRIAVNRFAYGYSRYSLPLDTGRFIPLPKGRIFAHMPKRGDIVVFEHTHTQRVMVKRLIGLPGDQVQVINEELYVNGQPLAKDLVRTVRYLPHEYRNNPNAAESAREVLEGEGGRTWLTYRLRSGGTDDPADNTVLFVVPKDHFFFMGDNRDNSIDSRFLEGHCPAVNGMVDRADCPPTISPQDAPTGFVRFDHLIGRADTIIMTLHRCQLLDDQTCPKRVWKNLYADPLK